MQASLKRTPQTALPDWAFFQRPTTASYFNPLSTAAPFALTYLDNMTILGNSSSFLPAWQSFCGAVCVKIVKLRGKVGEKCIEETTTTAVCMLETFRKMSGKKSWMISSTNMEPSKIFYSRKILVVANHMLLSNTTTRGKSVTVEIQLIPSHIRFCSLLCI